MKLNLDKNWYEQNLIDNPDFSVANPIYLCKSLKDFIGNKEYTVGFGDGIFVVYVPQTAENIPDMFMGIPVKTRIIGEVSLG